VVALKGFNDGEFEDLIAWAHDDGMEVTFIEVMPLGEDRKDEPDQYLSLDEVRRQLSTHLTLEPIAHRTGGPARYMRVKETGGRIGFITPLSHNFCESCNRVRVTCTGTLFMCLGQNDAADLREPLRSSESNEPLMAALEAAIARKPKGHDFVTDRLLAKPRVARPMSQTGG
jgi:cyclic pyranopterin phosphate synthase